MQAWLDAYHGISNSCKYPRTLHELKPIISWFSRKCRVEGEKIIVGQKRLDQKEQKAVHMGQRMWGRYGWRFPLHTQINFYFRSSENCISVHFKQSVKEFQPQRGCVFLTNVCFIFYDMFVLILKKLVEKQIPPIYSPLKKIFL